MLSGGGPPQTSQKHSIPTICRESDTTTNICAFTKKVRACVGDGTVRTDASRAQGHGRRRGPDFPRENALRVQIPRHFPRTNSGIDSVFVIFVFFWYFFCNFCIFFVIFSYFGKQGPGIGPLEGGRSQNFCEGTPREGNWFSFGGEHTPPPLSQPVLEPRRTSQGLPQKAEPEPAFTSTMRRSLQIPETPPPPKKARRAVRGPLFRPCLFLFCHRNLPHFCVLGKTQSQNQRFGTSKCVFNHFP